MRRLTLRIAVAPIAFITGAVTIAAWLVPQLSSLSESRAQVVEEKYKGSRSVSYRGVSFRYDLSLASDVKRELLPAHTLQAKTDKPEGVSPKHTAFSLVGSYASKHETSYFSPEIHIYPITGYKKALAVSKRYVQQLEADVRSLKSLLSHRPTSWKDEIPFLPFGIDASQSFRAHVKYISFQNGSGIMFLTQYDIEPSLINDSGLVYVFQGLTDEGRYYVSATFPVAAPSLNLPKAYDVGRYEGYTLPAHFYGKDEKSNEKNYQAYRNKMIRRLEELPPDKYEPSLTLCEELIRSLSVQGQSHNGM